ncbi:MAG: beta galactosidase jelly roll domain-containing protein [Clostridiales bacterium]|nr:beta galactosidase jelly roll domain-containing protein [Clostridiales bacterium]
MTKLIHQIKTHFCCFISTSTLIVLFLGSCTSSPSKIRQIEDFGKNWKFHLGDVANGQEPGLDDSQWRGLGLPHDWSIEGEFSKDHPATPAGGALPGGVAWYRKTFIVPESHQEKLVFIEFDGVYRNSEVWINGNSLGQRPYGYSSFRYELTPFLKYRDEKNLLAVRVDNSQQPNSRWYSGSGIYRNVWLVTTEKIFVDHWGTFITTPEVSQEYAKVSVQTQVRNTTPEDQPVMLKTIIYDAAGKKVSAVAVDRVIAKNSVAQIDQHIVVRNPTLWSLEDPYLPEGCLLYVSE